MLKRTQCSTSTGLDLNRENIGTERERDSEFALEAEQFLAAGIIRDWQLHSKPVC